MLDAHVPGRPRGHGRDLQLGAGGEAPRRGAGGAVRAASTPTTWGRRSPSPRRSPWTAPAAPRPSRGARTPRAWRPSSGPWRRRTAWRRRRERHRAGAPLRPLRGPLRARDADSRPRRARARLGHRPLGPGLRAGARGAAARLRGPAHAAVPGGPAVRGGGRHGLPQARGPAAHRRAQDQQRHRPVPAGQADGQAPDHRRDRRRPARRGHGHGLRAARPGLHRLHGHRGHAPPAAERRAHGAARRQGRAGRGRRAHAQGGRERGHPRLGDQRGHHPLRDRLGCRPGALPGARPRPPAHHRRRGAGAAAGGSRAGCRGG